MIRILHSLIFRLGVFFFSLSLFVFFCTFTISDTPMPMRWVTAIRAIQSAVRKINFNFKWRWCIDSMNATIKLVELYCTTIAKPMIVVLSKQKSHFVFLLLSNVSPYEPRCTTFSSRFFFRFHFYLPSNEKFKFYIKMTISATHNAIIMNAVSENRNKMKQQSDKISKRLPFMRQYFYAFRYYVSQLMRASLLVLHI